MEKKVINLVGYSAQIVMKLILASFLLLAVYGAALQMV
jgi:hypothetical protein